MAWGGSSYSSKNREKNINIYKPSRKKKAMGILKNLKHNFRYCVSEKYRELVKDWENTSLRYKVIFNYSGRMGKIQRLNRAIEEETLRRSLDDSLSEFDEKVLNRICQK